MPAGSKAKYSDKQKRQAAHIEASYEEKGVSRETAEARAWATVNKQSGGGEKSGSGRKTSPAAKSRARHDSAKRAVATREGKPRSSASSLGTQSKEALMKEARTKGITGRSKMRKQELIEALQKAS
ncbi:Rho termination factor N-terminal domain-containing protein [Pseudomonas akapageensis]|uniref:Rho termination factor N-terminal domain-containing protein n=1 Tax=Pseudomonas akapageensis TaxID=2609961 RepID=UPI00140870AE|nr:Rho termination factor N-terminal domain-containing protein [Pseudomonas akapageensis]